MTRLRLPLVLAGIAVLGGLALWAGLPAIGRAFAILGVGGFVTVVLVHLPLIGLMGTAWWSIDGAGSRLRSFIAARLARDAVADLLPFSQVGGFAAGVRVLSLTGIAIGAAARSLLADLLMEFFTKSPYALLGLALLVWLRPASPVPSYLVVPLALLVGMPFLALLLRPLLWRFVRRFLGRWIGPDGGGLLTLLTPRRLAPSGLLHLLGWTLGGVEAWVTLRLMGVPVTVLEALAIDSLVTSLRTFGFFVPAALGVQEAAYVLACGLFGLAPGEAMALSLVRRARDLLFGSAGLAVWQCLEVRRGRTSLSDLGTATDP